MSFSSHQENKTEHISSIKSTIHILLIEDNPIDAGLIEAMLSESTAIQFHLDCVDSLSKGIIFLSDAISRIGEQKNTENAPKKTIDIVLLDLGLPDSNGLETFIKLKKSVKNIPIVILSGRDDRETAVHAVAKGAQDYIVKGQAESSLLIRSLQYAIERCRLQSALEVARQKELKTNVQLAHSDKMASIGQLAAGVAHEINNPIGFVSSNLGTLDGYQKDIHKLILKYQKLISTMRDLSILEELPALLRQQTEDIIKYGDETDIEFIMDDIGNLILESRDGTERIKQIVIDLKDFAHPGEHLLQLADINKCIDSTLNIIQNEVKYKATIIKDYENVPLVSCYPQQINQVFMNIIINAAHAIEEKGEICIITKNIGGKVLIKISDNGSGIKKENIAKIFDPFFTTKPVGKGTGLGMNVAYNIIKKHNGTIDVESTLGKGTTFAIRIPVQNIQND